MKLSKFFVGFVAALVLSACAGTNAPEMHTITFNYNYDYGEVVEGEPAPTTIEVADGTVVTSDMLPTVAPREGYTFQSWCTTPACVANFDWSKTIKKDYTVYAAWVDLSQMDVLTLVGNITDPVWTPSLDTYVLESEDGIHYTIEDVVLEVGDIWKVIRNHAYDGTIDGNAIAESVDTSLYTVLTDGLDSGNIKMLVAGYYDITVDLSATKALTFVKTADYVNQNPVVGYEICLAGTFTDPQWAVNDGTKFAGDNGLHGTWTLTDYALVGGSFKLNAVPVRQDGTKDAATWVPTSVLTELPAGWSITDNINCVAGTYTFTYTIAEGAAADAGVLTVTGEASGPILAVTGFNVALAGTLNNWTAGDFENYRLTGNGTTDVTYTIENVVLANNDDGAPNFKITIQKIFEDDSVGSVEWASATLGEVPDGWTGGGGNNIVAVAGTYTISYHIVNVDGFCSGTLSAVAV